MRRSAGLVAAAAALSLPALLDLIMEAVHTTILVELAGEGRQTSSIRQRGAQLLQHASSSINSSSSTQRRQTATLLSPKCRSGGCELLQPLQRLLPRATATAGIVMVLLAAEALGATAMLMVAMTAAVMPLILRTGLPAAVAPATWRYRRCRNGGCGPRRRAAPLALHHEALVCRHGRHLLRLSATTYR